MIKKKKKVILKEVFLKKKSFKIEKNSLRQNRIFNFFV